VCISVSALSRGWVRCERAREMGTRAGKTSTREPWTTRASSSPAQLPTATVRHYEPRLYRGRHILPFNANTFEAHVRLVSVSRSFRPTDTQTTSSVFLQRIIGLSRCKRAGGTRTGAAATRVNNCMFAWRKNGKVTSGR
jgi:hypothetical protein